MDNPFELVADCSFLYSDMLQEVEFCPRLTQTFVDGEVVTAMSA